jgi:cbb3-type cytochrome c oxidase subunit III
MCGDVRECGPEKSELKRLCRAVPIWVALLAALAGTGLVSGPRAVAADGIEFSVENIKRGRALYSMHCVSCHGVDGRGDTEMREFLKTAPADLTDPEWIYGAADEALFDVIRAGRAARDMPAFEGSLTDERIRQVIHYVRYLGGKRP